jgi:ABC-type transporter Mla subunit MlaD
MNSPNLANSRDSLTALHKNLLEQQQCMLVDDLAGLSELVREQESLWKECEAYLASGVRDADTALQLSQLKDLVETNQLLAQQSLVFARKVLNLLVEDDGYSDRGKKQVRPGKSLDLRA